MVPAVTRALPLLALPLLAIATLATRSVRADEPPAAPAAPVPRSEAEPGGSIVPDDPGCVGKYPGLPCRLFDGGGGGSCVRALCGTAPGRPCLRCVPAPIETQVETPWIPMISLGVVVAIVGFVFWFRLKKAWG